MRIVITGGDEYRLTPGDFWFLERKAQEIGLKEIYTDGRRGVAAQIEAWARSQDIPVYRVKADFVAEGNAPYPRRNAMLVRGADGVIVFPGSAVVTMDLIEKARARRLPVYESVTRQVERMGVVLPKPGERVRRPGLRMKP